VLPFGWRRAASLEEALAAAAEGALPVAGGTEVVPWLRDGIVAPGELVDLSRLPLDAVTRRSDGGLALGATARLADLAAHPQVRAGVPLLAQAIAAAASPAIRHMSTLAGNLLQRTRCPYFRAGPGVPCNLRAPGTGCPARTGLHRTAAILGLRDDCIAAHPSDPAVALAALEAALVLAGPGGTRAVPVAEDLAEVVGAGELVTAVHLPAPAAGARVRFLKVRDRAAFDFALVSCAVVLPAGGPPRLALGGVAPGPWRCRTAEGELAGRDATPDRVRRAMQAELAAAAPLEANRFKVELAVRLVVRAVREALA
jgi:xanthine dehydrogenase YagS FAD-binding subunit